MQNDLEIIFNFHSLDINFKEHKLIEYLENMYMCNVIIENNLDLLFLKLSENNNIFYLDYELQLELYLCNQSTLYKFMSGKNKIISKINKKLKIERISYIILPLLIINEKDQNFYQNFIIFDKINKVIFKFGKILDNDEIINKIITNLVSVNFNNFTYQELFDSDQIENLYIMLTYFDKSKYNQSKKNQIEHSNFLINCFDFIFNNLWFKNLDRVSYHRLISDCNTSKIQTDTLKKLLKENESKLIELSIDGLTVLELACQKGLYNFTKILVDNEANINTRSEYGLNSPLHLAIKFNNNLNSDHKKIIEYLIYKNANVNSYDENLTTPLFTSAAKNDTETFYLLLEKGALINTKTITQKNIIHYMCSSPEFYYIQPLSFDILNKIIELGIKLEELDCNNSNTLHLACKYLNNNLVNWIIEISRKLNLDLINQKDSFGDKPLETVKKTHINLDQIESYLNNINILIDRNFAKIDSSDDKKSAELKLFNHFLIQQEKIINSLDNIII